MNSKTTIDEKRRQIWELAYQRALGCSHPDPFQYADQTAKEWKPAGIYHKPKATGEMPCHCKQ